jgi:hypothetical protein
MIRPPVSAARTLAAMVLFFGGDAVGAVGGTPVGALRPYRPRESFRPQRDG